MNKYIRTYMCHIQWHTLHIHVCNLYAFYSTRKYTGKYKRILHYDNNTHQFSPLDTNHAHRFMQQSSCIDGQVPPWDLEQFVGQSVHTAWPPPTLPMWGADDLCLHTIWSALPALLLRHSRDGQWSMHLLCLCQNLLLQGLPSLCLQLFCSHMFWRAWDSLDVLQREQGLHTHIPYVWWGCPTHQSLPVTAHQAAALVQVLSLHSDGEERRERRRGVPYWP